MQLMICSNENLASICSPRPGSSRGWVVLPQQRVCARGTEHPPASVGLWRGGRGLWAALGSCWVS